MPLAETVGFVVNTVNVIVERVCLHTKTERQPRVVGSWRYNRQTHQIFNMFQLQNSTYYCKIALVGWNKHSNRHNGQVPFMTNIIMNKEAYRSGVDAYSRQSCELFVAKDG